MFEGLLLPWLPSCFFIQFLEQLVKFLVNFTLLKYVKPQRGYCFFITKELIFGFQILDLKDHFSASLRSSFLIFTPKDLTISETTESTSVASYLDLLFLTQIMKKYAIAEISTEKKIICDTESINMWI